MSSLKMIDLLYAMLDTGALVFKTDEHIQGEDIYIIDVSPLPLLPAYSRKYKLYVMNPDILNRFIDACSANGIAVIPLEELTEAERQLALGEMSGEVER